MPHSPSDHTRAAGYSLSTHSRPLHVHVVSSEGVQALTLTVGTETMHGNVKSRQDFLKVNVTHEFLKVHVKDYSNSF